VRLTAQLSARLGTPVALRDLFAAPTVRSLAAAIEERRAGARHPNLAVIRAEGARAPLFLMHPVEGEVGYARTLAARLDPEIPVYGLSAPGLLAGEAPPRSLGAMVDTYRAAIREVQPRGPYRLAGWSAGGTIAHALAASLEQDGEEVSFLGLIDTAADYAGVRPPPPRDLAAAGADEATAARYRAVSEAILAAVGPYAPPPLAARIHLFAAAGEDRADPSLGWGAVPGARLVATPVAATHYGIVEAPAVDQLCAALSAALAGA
jgi:syringomycin synthetase protein SyrE